MMTRALLFVALMLGVLPGVVAGSQAQAPIEPIAHTPDATQVRQMALSQDKIKILPMGLVFTEYEFATNEMAANYFVGICSFLESDMLEKSPEGMNYLPIRQDGNPKCGFSRGKGTQAYSAVVFENRVLTVWAYGLGIDSDAGKFLTTFMHAKGVYTDEATFPNPAKVGDPWKVDEKPFSITEYAQTAYEQREDE